MSHRSRVVLGVVATFVVLLGVVAFVVTPYVFVAIIIPLTHITSKSLIYPLWQNSMVPPSMQFYVYDLKNSLEVVQTGAKPFFIQRGPYTYRELRPKLNVTFNGNGTVTYDQPKTFVYLNDPNDDENVNVTTLNLPVLILADLFSHLPTWEAFLADGVLEALEGGSLFVKKSATEAIWGWQDPLIHFVIERVEKWFHVSLEGKDLMGFYIKHNASSEGIWNVWDGIDDYRKTNTIHAWKGQTSLPYWSSPYANMLNGTDGLSYWPNVQQTDTIYLFHFDICRSTRFHFDSVVYNRGIKLYRFVMDDSMVADPETYPENRGFCPHDGPCLKAGVWNVSACNDRVPIILSLPQFFLADPSYQDAVAGLNPTRSLHETFVEIEPITGYSLRGNARVQINLPVRPIPGLPETANIKPLLYPAIWVDHGGAMDDNAAQYMSNMVYLPQTLVTVVVPAVLLTIGLLLAVVLAYRFHRAALEAKDQFETAAPAATSANHDHYGAVADRDGDEDDGRCRVNSTTRLVT